MALLDSYATLADLRARLSSGGVTLSTTDDPILTSALASASRSIETATNRQFNLDTGLTSRVYYPTSQSTAIVDDISTTAGLVVATDSDDDGVYETTWLATDYLLRPINGIEHGVPGWPYSRIDAVGGKYFPMAGKYAYTGPIWREYLNSTFPLIHRRPGLQVTATFGWPTAPPENVRQACLILAEELYKLKDAPYGVAGWSQYGAIRVRENPKVAELLTDYNIGQVIFS